MKQIILVLFTFLLLISAIESKRYHRHLNTRNKRARNGTSGNTTASNASTSGRPNIPTIKFGAAATQFDKEINSVGEKVEVEVTLNQFPFKISRCDQVVFFPCAYINDDNDYRVRKSGYFVITALYSNLYDDKDAQKLIQHITHTSMEKLPSHVTGAEGCIHVGADKGQKDMIICVPTKANAANLIEVYRDFTRCRIGDNLTPISAKDLAILLKLCGVNRKALLMSNGKMKLKKLGGFSSSSLTTEKFDSHKIKGLAKNKMSRKRKPEFEFPSEEDNKWEQDRLRYFMPTPLKVPGQSPFVRLPPGIKPGVNPVNNPGVASY